MARTGVEAGADRPGYVSAPHLLVPRGSGSLEHLLPESGLALHALAVRALPGVALLKLPVVVLPEPLRVVAELLPVALPRAGVCGGWSDPGTRVPRKFAVFSPRRVSYAFSFMNLSNPRWNASASKRLLECRAFHIW